MSAENEERAPEYVFKPGAEPGRGDPRRAWVKGAPIAFWTKGPTERVFVVYAHDVRTALERLFAGAPPGAFPPGSIWELWDTPLPEPARATGVLA